MNRPAAGSSLDLDWVRGRFPALQGDWTLMDNAGGTAPVDAVATRIADYLREWPVQLGASYAPSAEAGRLQEQARHELASLFATGGGAAPSPGQIAIGASSTSLFSRLARSLAPGLQPGDEVIVSEADHEANIGPWLRLAERGIRVRWWRLNRDSQRLEAADLDALIGARTRLVCFTHASNILGGVNDPRPIIARARAVGARVCIDGVAFAPHRPLAVTEWDADWYGFSLYKVFGPHLALLYSSPDAGAALTNLNHEWMQADTPAARLEPGAWPYELAWGAAAVTDYLRELSTRHGTPAFAAIAAHERHLVGRLLDWLGSQPGLRILGAPAADADRLPTVSFVSTRRSPAEIVRAVDRAGIGIRHGHFYAPRLVEALGLARSTGVVRISLAHYNTAAEVDRLLEALQAAL